MELLTEEEMQKLVMALMRGKGAVTQHEIEKVYTWARDIRLKQGMLENIFLGNVYLTMQEENVLVALTPEGKVEAEKLIEEGAVAQRQQATDSKSVQ